MGRETEKGDELESSAHWPDESISVSHKAATGDDEWRPDQDTVWQYN